MPVNLAQNADFFTPEVQMKMFERGVNGIDISNGIPQRRPDITQTQEFKEMQNIYQMVQNGDLVPKNLIQQTQVQQPQYSQPVETQYVPATQVQSEQQIQQEVQNPDNDLMKILFPERVQPAPVAQAPVQQVAPQQTYQQNEPPSINWEEVIQEQQNTMLQESAKRGIKGEEVMQWMGQLAPADYLEMYQMFNQRQQPVQQIPVQQQVVQQAPVYNQNNGMITWANNHNQEQYAPSIADMPGSEPVTAYRSQSNSNHPFGL